MSFLLLIILFTLYFLPSIVAIMRKAPDTGSVIVLNLFLGWTFLGWVISMAVAARSNNAASINVNVSQQPGYGYAGVAYGPGQPAVAATYGGPPASQLLPGHPQQQLPPVPLAHPRQQIPQAQPNGQVRRNDQAARPGPAPSETA